jgi:hypothetical protein
MLNKCSNSLDYSDALRLTVSGAGTPASRSNVRASAMTTKEIQMFKIPRLSCRRRVISGTTALVVLLGLAFSASAFGFSQVIFNGFTAGYLSSCNCEHAPNRHSLTSADADNTGGYDGSCVNALNDSDGTWAGETYCTYSYTSHPYCGCRLRWGYNMDSGQFLNTNHVNYGTDVVGIQYY